MSFSAKPVNAQGLNVFVTKNMKKTIQQLINESLKDGWRMTKKISSGGFFTSPTYDDRKVYNQTDLFKLIKEGFVLEESLGMLALNILLRYEK